MNFPEVAEHLTTGATLAMTGPGQGSIFGADAGGDFHDFYVRAMAADAELDAG